MTEAAEVYEDEEVANDEFDAIKAAFDEAIAEEKEEDFIKLQMISAGATFKSVTRLYNQYMIDAGLAISKADRNQILDDVMEDRDVETEEDFNAAVEALVASMKGATARSAGAQIRSFAKKNDISVYAKPKSEGPGRVGFTNMYHDWLVANIGCTEDEAKAYIMGEGDHAETSDHVKRNLSSHIGAWELVKTTAEKVAA